MGKFIICSCILVSDRTVVGFPVYISDQIK